jgi:hypothetical protein
VSVVWLFAGLYVLLHGNYDADLQKAATGWIGVILGFWLR